MVLVPAAGEGGGVMGGIDIAAAPEDYILNLLDGENTVKSIKKSCCLCEYKVYESINVLLQSRRVAAQQQKYTQSIQAALARKEAEVASVLRTTLFSSILSAWIAAAFILFFLFCRMSLLPMLDANTYNRDVVEQRRISDAMNSDAVQGASILYRILTGKTADVPAVLKEFGLLTDRDLK